MLCCELLYFTALAPKLAETLRHLLLGKACGRRAVALVSHTVRRAVYWDKAAG